VGVQFNRLLGLGLHVDRSGSFGPWRIGEGGSGGDGFGVCGVGVAWSSDRLTLGFVAAEGGFDFVHFGDWGELVMLVQGEVG
jgi:hypothetical protein